MKVHCQFALYPLKQENVGEILAEAQQELDRPGITYQVGSMSTEMQGEDQEVFPALRDAFRRVAGRGQAVLVVTLSNACGGGGYGYTIDGVTR